MASTKVTSTILPNGLQMPDFGLGTWRAEPGVVGKAVREALEMGYRHFDCAFAYENEVEIGPVLQEYMKEGKVKREDLFITSKLWNTCHDPKHVRQACEYSCKNLQLEYVDLYLVHYPLSFQHTGIPPKGLYEKDENGCVKVDMIPLHETWREMEKLVELGLAKSIGVSNYDILHMIDVLAYAKIKPANNQIETHPYFARQDLVDFCNRQGVSVTAHTPLGGAVANTELLGSDNPLDDPVIIKIAKEIGKTPAQVLLRWGVQRHTIVIPKSVKNARLSENFGIFDFKLSDEHMKEIKALDRGTEGRSLKIGPFWGFDPYQ